MKRLIFSFRRLNIWLKVVFIFCLANIVFNLYGLYRCGAGLECLRYYLGFSVLYAAQAWLILMRDWRAALFSLLQCVFSYFAVAGATFYIVFKPLYEVCAFMGATSFIDVNYIFLSMMFTLELLKTALIYDFLKYRRIYAKR